MSPAWFFIAGLTVALCLSSASADTVTVYPNGEHSPDTPGVEFPLTSSRDAMLQFISDAVPASWFGREASAKARLMNHLGVEVPPDMEGVGDGDALYLLSDDYLWMWPTVDHGHKVFVTIGDDTDDPRTIGIETIGLAPKVFFLDNLLTEEEAEHFKNKHSEAVKPSTVGSQDPQLAPGRTGKNTWDQKSPEAQAVIQRCFKLLRVPYQFNVQDGLQIVQYDAGQFYNEHYDYLDSFDATAENTLDATTGGTNRYATIFMYLNDVEEGGQTGFSKADPLTDEQLAKMSPELVPLLSAHKMDYDYETLATLLGRKGMEVPMAKTCQSSLAVRPKKLGAVLFYNMQPDLSFDPMPLHSGCPVKEGFKWGANLWVWNGNKAGTGKPQSTYDMVVAFKNKFPHAIKVYWVSGEERVWLIDIDEGSGTSHNTFEGHVFEFAHKDTDVALERFYANKEKGKRQTINLPQHGHDEL